MSFVPLNLDDLDQGSPVDEALLEQIKDNFNALNGLIGAAAETSTISNGSFEVDSDSDGIPDNWEFTPYPGGTATVVTSPNAHGAKAFAITHPGGAGNGGGYLESDYKECSEYFEENIRSIVWTDAAGNNQVEIRYYDEGKVYISSEYAYSSTSTPATPHEFIYQFTPVATARFIKIRLIGGFNDTDSAGVTYFGYVGKYSRNVQDYLPGSIIIATSSSIETITTTGWAKYKEIQVVRDGVLTVSFALGDGLYTGSAHARIYINGSAVGTLRNQTDSSTTYSENIEVVSQDLVQLYAYVDAYGGTNTSSVSNFYLKNIIQLGEYTYS